MNFKIIKKIASGTFGTVFKVKNAETNEIYAFKSVHENFKNSKELKRVKRGFDFTQKVSHINCVKLIEWVEDSEKVGFLMEFVDGEPITKLKFQNEEKEDFLDKLRIISKALLQTCNGLEALHSKGIIHRDLKPENILISSSNEIKITDFDLVKFDDILSYTTTGSFIGTVRFSSPEQCTDSTKIDKRSDLYSLGVIFYNLVTGIVPFDGKNFAQIVLGHIRSPLILPRNLNPNIPLSVEKIIVKLLEKNPDDRFNSAKEVSEILSKILSEELKVMESSTLGYLLQPNFVGRNSSLRALEKVYSNVSQKNGQAIFIIGESGIGKSKLWEEFKIGAILKTKLIFETLCQKDSSIYEPLKLILLKAFELLKSKPDEQKEMILGKMGKDLKKIISEIEFESFYENLPDLVELEGKAGEMRLFNAICEFLINLSNELGVIILFFDGLQWVDEQTSKWISFAINNFKNERILIVGTDRQEELVQNKYLKNIPEFEKRNLIDIIRLDSLKFEEVNEMISSMVGEKSAVSTKFASEIQKYTNGNPLFIQEIMYHLYDTKNLQTKSGKLKVDMTSLSDIILPDTVFQAIRERINRLDKNTKNILEVSALLGKAIKLSILQEVLEFPYSTFKEILQKVLETKFVKLVNQKNELHFVYDSAREAIEKNISYLQKKKYHFKIASIIEKLHSDTNQKPIEELANHYFYAEIDEKSANYCFQAAEISEKNFAIKKSLNFFSKSIEVYERNFKIKEALKASIQKIKVLENISAWEELEKNSLKALKLAKQISAKEEIGFLFYCLSIPQRINGNFEKAISFANKSLETYKELNDIPGTSRALGNIGNIYTYFDKIELALINIDKSISICSQNDLEELQSIELINKSIVLINIDNHSQATETLEKAQKLLKDSNNFSILKKLNMCFGAAYSGSGKYKLSEKYYLESLKISEFKETLIH